MKKGLSILLSFLVLAVSFSIPSYAAGAYSKLTFDDYTITGTVTVDVFGQEYVISDSSSDVVIHNYSGVGFSYPLSVKLPMNAINGGTAVTATGGTGIYTFKPVYSLTHSYAANQGVQFNASLTNFEYHFQDDSVYSVSNQYSRLCFDCSVLYNRKKSLDHQFYLSFNLNFSGSALDNEKITFTYSIKLTAQTLEFYPTMNVDSTVLKEQTDSINNNTTNQITNQTTNINNNITEQTEKQTDTLTTGFNNDGMENSNKSLSTSLNDYDSKEGQITDSSINYIDGVTFIKPSSNKTLLTSISFCTAWLQSLFVNLGSWSILITVSLSLTLGLMLIGWFKYR